MRYHQFVLRHPKAVVAIVLLITAILGWLARGVELNNSMEELLPSHHPSVLQDKELKRVFESREMLLLGLIHEDGIFNRGTLQKVKEITEKLWEVTAVRPDDVEVLATWGRRIGGHFPEAIEALLQGGLTTADRGQVTNLLLEAKAQEGVDPAFVSFLESLRLELAPISDIVSLASVDDVRSTEWGLEIAPTMSRVPQTSAELADLESSVFANDLLVDLLVSRDRTGTLILVELSFYYDDHLEIADRVFEEVRAIALPYEGPEEIHVAGVPMVNVTIMNYMASDLARLTPLVVLIAMVVMYLSSRLLRGVLLPLAVSLLALVWTLGIIGLSGRPITLMVSAMPVMLIAIGIADGIHLTTEYRVRFNKHRDNHRAILETMHQLTRPVVLTSLTTMGAFLSMTTSSLRSIQDFGAFTSFGVFAAMLISLTFVPAALKLMPAPKPRVLSAPVADSREGTWTQRLSFFAARHPSWVYTGVVVLAAGGVIAVSSVGVGSAMVAMFPDDSEIYRASEMLNQRFGGTEVMNIVIDTGAPDGLKDPATLGKIAALQAELESIPLVGYTVSVADYVRRINYVMNDQQPAYDRIPRETEVVEELAWTEDPRDYGRQSVEVSGRNQIGQYILLYENAGGDDLTKLADFDYSKANVVVMIRDDSTPELGKILRTADNWIAAAFGDEAEVTFAGCATLCVVADEMIIPGQIKTLGVAFVAILILLAGIFRSVRLGLIGLLPMVLSVLAVFAVLAVFRIRLDAMTALIGSIVLGVGVDNSVHFISRFKSLRDEGSDVDSAIRRAVETSGRAILFNSLAISSGFFVLMLSNITPVVTMGWVVAVVMIFCCVVTLIVLPTVLMHHERIAEPVKSRRGTRPSPFLDLSDPDAE